MAGRLFKQEVALLQALSRHARANAIGYLALFVALSGTALAAGSLARNSVGTAQLKNRAVTGRKVARKTLTGFNIRVSTLGTVPNSNRLGGLPPFAFQARVTGACSGNRAIAHITFTGTVVCHATAGSAITRVAAGTDLTGGGSSGTVTLSDGSAHRPDPSMIRKSGCRFHAQKLERDKPASCRLSKTTIPRRMIRRC